MIGKLNTSQGSILFSGVKKVMLVESSRTWTANMTQALHGQQVNGDTIELMAFDDIDVALPEIPSADAVITGGKVHDAMDGQEIIDAAVAANKPVAVFSLYPQPFRNAGAKFFRPGTNIKTLAEEFTGEDKEILGWLARALK